MNKQISPLNFLLGICTLVFCSSTALAIDLDETTRTVPLDSSGSTVILTPEQVKKMNLHLSALWVTLI